MKVYIYDGTFKGLLELITYLKENQWKPDFIKNERYEPTLLDEVIHLKLTTRKNLMQIWKSRVGSNALKISFYVFLSNAKEKELILYYFLSNALKYKEKIIYRRNLKCVNKSLKISGEVSHEIHKLKGFLRFKETKNHFLYALVEPTNDILYFLAIHFKERLKKENFLIWDKIRAKICVYDKKNIFFFKEKDFTSLNLDLEEKELEIEDLWKFFFESVSIKERKNEKCQRNFMPKKYWKYIIEMEEKNEKSNNEKRIK